MATASPPYVLLIEDEEDHITLTRRALAKADPTLELVVARSGREVLTIGLLYRADQRGQRAKPLFVLLDLNMPGVNGMVVMTLLKSAKEAAKVPIIVLTSSTEELDRVESLGQGADAFFSKPVTVEMLSELLRRYKN